MAQTGKSSSMVALKVAGSFAKAIPIIGIAAQVAYDMKISSDIENNRQGIANNAENINKNADNIEKNTDEIYYNRKLIQRLNEEFSILGDAVVTNKLQISQLAEQLVETDQRIEGLSSEIGVVAENLAVVAEVVQGNAKKIEQLKDNFFITGAEELQKYYDTDNDAHLIAAMNNFGLYKNIRIDSPEVSALARQYYIIALSEVHRYKLDTNDIKLDVEANRADIKKEFESLMKIVPPRYEMLSIVMNSYVSILDVLTKEEISLLKPPVEQFYKKVVEALIVDKRFDTAVFVAENYAKLMKDESLLMYANEERKKNFEVEKQRLTQQNAEEIVDENENTLLTELAIKKLTQNDDREMAMKILQRKFLADQTFRYKAYLKLYYELGEDEKYKKLEKLISENNTYPKQLKQFVEKDLK
jgi:hypothetical protein